MDKENGETSESGTNSSKLSNAADPASLLDAANLFGAYWGQRDPSTSSNSSAAAAGLFAAAGGSFGSPLGPHPGLPFGLLPPSAAAAAAAAAAAGRGGVPTFPPVSSAAAYTNTLSVAASQAASLGINPAASAAWWSMASQLAAQDYIARLQASGLNFPALNPADPYASLGLPSLTSHHKSSKNSSKSSSSSLSKNSGGSKGKTSATALSLQAGAKLDGRLDPIGGLNKSGSGAASATTIGNNVSLYNKSSPKLSSKPSSLTIQPSIKSSQVKKPPSLPSPKPSSTTAEKVDYNKQSHPKSSTPKSSQVPASSIFTSPLSLVSNSTPDKDKVSSGVNTFTTQSLVNSSISSGIPPNILSAALEGSDPSSILGGVRLPPDTEIIKYTSSIVGPKIPGTTNRGRKKTISLDPPSVSVMPTHSSTGMLIERGNKWAKLTTEPQDLSTSNDRVEVIKLPATNGSPSGINVPSYSGGSEQSNDTPLNLSLKPASTSSSNCQSSSNSLNSLSNLSANIGSDRISRRKPGPKPRRVIQSPSQLSNTIPGAPSASLAQLFAAADSPRPPSRSDDNSTPDSSAPSSMMSNTNLQAPSAHSQSQNHKDGRPRNLGRGVSKPKKNTVASLLAQSRALGIKPMQIDPNTPMNQQISLLKSNMLAAQFMADSMDEKHFEKLRGALSDSSNMEVSTDSDNLTDSNQTDSEPETDANGVSNPKKRRIYNERELRLPLEQGWKRETIIRGLTKNGGIKGDVCYTPPDTNIRLKQMFDIVQYLEQMGNGDLTRENFTFTCKIILGDYLQKPPPGATSEGEYLRMTEEEVTRRLDDLRSITRTSLAVEQRIEVARRQQAARAAARLDREHARIARDIERNEKQEAAKRDREVRSQQLQEGRKRLAFTLEQKVQIISEIEGGKTKSDVSRELGLASSTVATIWKNREHILNVYGGTDTDRLSSDADQTLSKTKNSLSFFDSSLTCSDSQLARRKRHEELGRQRYEEQQRKLQEREIKKQQAAMLKEQMYIQELNKQREMLYTVELERERRRQHMSLVKALEARRRLEERERKKQQAILEKQASKERRLEQRRIDMEILTELRKPCEDLELTQKSLPEYPRIPGLRLSGQAFADILMVFEFLHNFGETLGFDMESLPCLDSMQQALLNESLEAEEELLSVMTHLLVCAIEDPGIPNPARHTTLLGQSLRQADITHQNLSEILRIYLYANATGEVKALTGVHFERDREKRVADHYQNNSEMQHTQGGKNAAYYELLHENATWQMSDSLKDKPFLSLCPTDKAAMLAFLCNELLQNKAVIRQIEGSLDNVAQLRKERWLLDTKIRKYRMMTSRKLRSEATEKMQAQLKDGLDNSGTNVSGDATPRGVDSPAPTPTPHKDDLLVDEEEEISENESEGTQPEEEEDKKLSGEELNKKLEKLLKISETQLQSLNTSAHQLRATCFGQDRYWRRYWSLSTAGGIFIEAMESAQPEFYAEQINEESKRNETEEKPLITSIEDIKKIVSDTDLQDPNADKEVSQIVGQINNDLDSNEHRKTPNRPSSKESQVKTEIKEENGTIKTELDDLEDQIPSKLVEKPGQKNLNLFKKLGECMEKESEKIEEKPEIKTEPKPEVIKTEIKSEEEEKPLTDLESKWFSILSRDSNSCEGVNMSSGNRWDSNSIGICTRETYPTELKIPVFPPPNCQNSYISCSSCDSPGPLQMSTEESVQLEHIKQHGLPPRIDPAPIPPEQRNGWWRITDPLQLKEALDNMHPRGCRERELKRTVQATMQAMYECSGNVQIEEGQKAAIELNETGEKIEGAELAALEADKTGMWNPAIAARVDLSVLEQVEALEDKVANASMQVKGWKVPNRDNEEVIPGQAVQLAKERLAALESAIERRYLKPPLGVCTGDANLAAIAQDAQNLNTSTSSSSSINQQQREQPSTPTPVMEEIPKGLTVWREAVHRSQTSAQVAMCLYMLEASIAWDKSIMKANCQFCHSGDNEDKLLLCDSCDKGYHTYCFKPKMETIPEGNWYCHECINKVTGERNCIVCGKKQSTGRLILCDLCPRAYHQDCLNPPLNKVPRGKWYCTNCHSKQPAKKKPTKKPANKTSTTTTTTTTTVATAPPPTTTTTVTAAPITRDSESSDLPPASPAPSHSSVTTNDDLTNQSTSSLTSKEQLNTSGSSQQQNSSPSTSVQRKDRVSKKLQKELAPCKTILEDLECHDDAWPFLLPVNTKQFPTYKKIITSPMDLSTIKKRLNELYYKSRDEFYMDVRQIFDNCETFNEDDSPVGKAGHCMRQFFEARWNELCPPHIGKS